MVNAGFNGSGAVQMVYAEKLFDKFPMPDVFFGLHVAGLLSPQGRAPVCMWLHLCCDMYVGSPGLNNFSTYGRCSLYACFHYLFWLIGRALSAYGLLEFCGQP